MASDFKKVIQELIVPELKEIKLEQKSIHTQIDSFRNEMKTEIRRLDEKMDSFRNEVKAEVGSLRNEMDAFRNEMRTEVSSLRNEMGSEIRHLDEKLEMAIQVRERLAVLESKAAVSGH